MNISESEKSYIIQQLRDINDEDLGDNKDKEEIEHDIGRMTDNGSWQKLKDYCEEVEEDHDVDLSGIRDFVEQSTTDDLVQDSDSDEIVSQVSEGALMGMANKVSQIEGDKILLNSDECLSVKDIFELQEMIYENQGKCVFTISNQKMWSGRIPVELSDTKEKIELLRVYQNEEGQLKFKHLGESASNYKGNKVVDQHNQGFFIYKFVSDNTEYLLLSTEKLSPQTCEVEGTHFSLSDYKQIGDNAGLPVDRDVIIAGNVQPAVRDLDEAEFARIANKVDHEWLAERLLGDWRHPEWFEKMLLTVLMVNEEHNYPSPLLWMAGTGTGKSKVVKAISKAFDEGAGVFSGTNSTVKGLTPSFADSPPDEGFLLRTNRVAPIDEVFNLLRQATRGDGNKQDAFRPLLDLLEHNDRTFESGNGSIRGKLDSWMIGAGNDSYGVETMSKAADKLDQPFLGRCLLYEQTESHIRFIEERKYEINESEAEMPQGDEDFISLFDHLRDDVAVPVDSDRIMEVKEGLGPQVPSNFKEIYRGRYDHHIKNLVSGHAKYRSMVEGDMDFEAQDVDYKFAEKTVEMLISSWKEAVDLSEISLPSRPYYLPSSQRRLYQYIVNNYPVGIPELKDEFEDDMNVAFQLQDIEDLDLIEEVKGEKYPFFADEIDAAPEWEGLL